ncbi:hypothetical protein [Yersinia enterocolitica]|uniref:hypothetical protein n=1 Tax=Yersinia enterocolitica TaxID=630 RepID=UPI001C8D86B7|nr:hypothetical protein [Yersinia enterocolitica]MBX9476800.1 hypothetical protein [Yersinia enterocolitica]
MIKQSKSLRLSEEKNDIELVNEFGDARARQTIIEMESLKTLVSELNEYRSPEKVLERIDAYIDVRITAAKKKVADRIKYLRN